MSQNAKYPKRPVRAAFIGFAFLSVFVGAMNGIGAFVIPRHGGRPSPVPTSHPASARLPGAINMNFYDGSVAHVQLEKLWQLTWHKNWVAPDRRPGR